MKIFIYPVHFLLVILLLGVTACGTQSSSDIDEEDKNLCSDPENADFEERDFIITLPYGIKWNGMGDETNFDFDLGIIYLAAASEGPDDEAIGTLTLLFYAPKASGQPERCLSAVYSATLSTSDARVGTGEEINGKLYSLVTPPTQGEKCVIPINDATGEVTELQPYFIEFGYVSGDVAHGWFCVEVEEISPGSGEPFLIAGDFAIRNR